MLRFRLKKTGILFTGILLAVSALFCAAAGFCDALIPNRIVVYTGERADRLLPAFVSLEEEEALEAAVWSDRDAPLYTEIPVRAKLFGLLPFKTVRLGVVEPTVLSPGGMPFGVRLYTDGVLVVGISAVTTEAGEVSPANAAQIRTRDVLTSIDGVKVFSTEEVTAILENAGGRTLRVTLRRGERELETALTPVCSTEGVYRAGIWIRDSTAGIGTVTYIDPETMAFAGLGHGICDVDTGELMPLRRATVSDVTLNGILRGKSGMPGELRGLFGAEIIGSLDRNTVCGVFGRFSRLPEDGLSEALPIAIGREVEDGAAVIRCAVDGSLHDYAVHITRLRDDDSPTKNFVLRVSDPALLRLTGGIVQGMSGSPVLQNGRLIGAVTHVMINDPTKGYGIYVENMLRANNPQ